MKESILRNGRRTELGKISVATLGDIKGQVEAIGLYTPRIRLR
jgi:hypothetical protein